MPNDWDAGSSAPVRIWVSEDRNVLLNVWDDGQITVALRDHPSQTWGPPITLTEEKT